MPGICSNIPYYSIHNATNVVTQDFKINYLKVVRALQHSGRSLFAGVPCMNK